MIHFRLLVLLMGLGSVLYGQSTYPKSTKTDCPDCSFDPRWVIKFAPLSIVDPDNTIQFALERSLGRRQSVQVELGYGWESIGLWETTARGRFSNKETWRGRAEWRLYFRPQARPLGFYAAAEGLYKQVNVQETTSNGLPCVGECPPGLLGKAPALKHVWGGHLKIGYQRPILSSDRLLVDVYWGLGARYRQVDRPDLPVGITLQEEPNLFRSLPAFPFSPKTEVSMSLGVKLGYAF